MTPAACVKPEDFFTPDEWLLLTSHSSFKGLALLLQHHRFVQQTADPDLVLSASAHVNLAAARQPPAQHCRARPDC